MSLLFPSLMVWTLGFFLDTSTTVLGLHFYGGKEENPFAEVIIKKTGFFGFTLYQAVVWITVLVLSSFYFDDILGIMVILVGAFRYYFGFGNLLQIWRRENL